MQLRWLLCLGLLLSVLSTTAAGMEQANCTLEMQGYGPARQGVKYMQLHCETSDGGDVLIGVDAGLLGKTEFRGVAVPKELPDCQRWYNEPGTDLPLYALLYFCDPNYEVTVVSPTVSNVHWDGEYGEYFTGLMVVDRVTLTISGGTFRGNSVITGNIIKAGGSVVVAIMESQFKNNTGGSGAIIIGDAQAEVRLTKTTFADNKALGGFKDPVNSVVLVTHSTLKIDNCTFYHNSADGHAGAVETTRSNVSISNSVFEQNHAVRYGAVSFVDGSNVTIRNTTFSSNTAEFAGALGSIDSEIWVMNSRLSSNSVGGDGGACYFSYSVVQIGDSVFSNNSAPYLNQGRGAALCVSGSQITMSGSNFTGNQGASGGVLFVFPDASLNATNCIFRYNMCPISAGVGGVLSIYGNASFSSCIVEANSASVGGVVSAWSYANVTISNGSRIAHNSADDDGGAFCLVGFASLTVLGSKIVNNTAGTRGGAIYAEEDTVVKLVDSQLLGNSAAPGAGSHGGAIFAKDNSTVTLVDSRIDGNSAERGGGVCMLGDVVLTANASIISNNTAITAAGVYGDGGTIAFLDRSRVEYNKAVDYGGGVWLETEFDVEQVRAAVHNNTAMYDKDISVPATSISIASWSPNKPGMVSSLQNGSLLYIFDVKGVHGLPSEYSFVYLDLVSLSDESQTFTLGQFKSGARGGVETYVDVPPDRYNVSVTVNTNPTLSLNFSIEFPFCGIGMASGVNGRCLACPGGSYNLIPESSKCQPCPDGAQCLGGAMVTPEPSYWRSTPLSDQVHRCPNPVACQPVNAELVVSCANNTVERAANITAKLHATDAVCNGTNYKTLQCSSGYQGNLCGVCAVGYGSTNIFTCRQCMSRGLLLAMYVLAAVVLLGAIKVICHFTLSETTLGSVTATTAQPLRQTCSKPRVTDLLKPLVIYFQYFLVVATANLDWPQSISYPLKALAWVFSSTSPETLSVDCLFSDGGLPVAIKKTLFYLIAPLFMLGMLLLLEAIGHVWRKRSNAGSRKTAAASIGDLLVSSSIVVLFFFLPSLARTTLSMFACITIDALGASSTDIGLRAIGRYWLLDVNQQCFQGYHARWSFGLGVPLLVLVCCTLPGAIFYLAFKSRKHLNKSASFDRHYAFLFRTYKPSCNFWEGVIAMQTVTFVTVSVFGHALGPYYQILLIVFVLNCVHIMLLVFKPYAQAEAQHVMEYGVLCLLLTAFTSLTFLPDGYMQVGSTSSTYKLVMGVLLVLLNAIFVAYVAWRLFTLVPWVKIIATLKATATKSLSIVKSQVSGIGCAGSFSALAKRRINAPGGTQQSPA